MGDVDRPDTATDPMDEAAVAISDAAHNNTGLPVATKSRWVLAHVAKRIRDEAVQAEADGWNREMEALGRQLDALVEVARNVADGASGSEITEAVRTLRAYLLANHPEAPDA